MTNKRSPTTPAASNSHPTGVHPELENGNVPDAFAVRNGLRESVHRGRNNNAGFTLVEVLVALVILLVGIAGILTLQMTAYRSTSFSRHATEASMLAERKLEELRMEGAGISNGSDVVDALGNAATGPFTRDWTVATGGADMSLEVEVTWLERDQSKSIKIIGKKNL